MEELINKNNQLFKEEVEILPHFQKSIDGVMKNYQYYFGSIKKRKKQEEERIQRMRRIEELHQIEEWTERRITNILFDSDKDDWNQNTSVFDQRIKNKEHIVIIIEDEEGNKFGGYVNSKIDKVGKWIYDSKSFVFSLESKGRMKRMKKFDIKQPEYAFLLDNQTNNYLFAFGWSGDILVCKENYKTISSCKQCSFEFEGISNALCGKEYTEPFTPKRIIVIEMK